MDEEMVYAAKPAAERPKTAERTQNGNIMIIQISMFNVDFEDICSEVWEFRKE